MATATHLRGYQGPAILSGGYRPFFLAGAVWAALAMAVWILVLAGWLDLGTGFGPVDWHVHEMIFGYGGAVTCGFLLTAVPNWTGRLPVAGAPLLALLLVWASGRAAIAFGGGWHWGWVALADLAFPAALTGIIGREIFAAGNRRNLPVLALCAAFLGANAGFHLAAADGAAAYDGYGARLGIAVLVMLISLIGGRVVPSFTRNWLAQRGPGALPRPFAGFDGAALALTAVALVIWVAQPVAQAATGWAMLAAGAAQVLRLARWAGWRCMAEPLVVVLHAAYAFLPVGFLLLGTAFIWPDRLMPAAGLHAWLAGGVGLMTVAMMTRASLGHSGRALKARWIEVAIFLLIAASAVARIVAAIGADGWWRDLAALAWITGFTIFVIAYVPILTTPRALRKPSQSPPV